MWGVIVSIIGYIITAVTSVATAIWAALVAMWAVIAPIVIPIWTALKAVWGDVLVPFWRLVGNVFDKLREWWGKYLSPVTNFIKKVYEVERDLYKALFQPLLDTITRIKQFLEVTGLAHTALGKAIEDLLGHLYADINAAYQSVVQPINQVINTIETYILDAKQLLRTDLLLGSIFASIKGVWSLWWNSGIHEVTPEGKRQLKRFGRQQPVRQTHQHARDFLHTGSGPYAPHIQGAVQTFASVTVLEDPAGLPPLETEV